MITSTAGCAAGRSTLLLVLPAFSALISPDRDLVYRPVALGIIAGCEMFVRALVVPVYRLQANGSGR